MIDISIHVPAWGTTRGATLNEKEQINFNPRSRVGNDGCECELETQPQYFNPRSRVGNDECKIRVLVIS